MKGESTKLHDGSVYHFCLGRYSTPRKGNRYVCWSPKHPEMDLEESDKREVKLRSIKSSMQRGKAEPHQVIEAIKDLGMRTAQRLETYDGSDPEHETRLREGVSAICRMAHDAVKEWHDYTPSVDDKKSTPSVDDKKSIPKDELRRRLEELKVLKEYMEVSTLFGKGHERPVLNRSSEVTNDSVQKHIADVSKALNINTRRLNKRARAAYARATKTLQKETSGLLTSYITESHWSGDEKVSLTSEVYLHPAPNTHGSQFGTGDLDEDLEQDPQSSAASVIEYTPPSTPTGGECSSFNFPEDDQGVEIGTTSLSRKPLHGGTDSDPQDKEKDPPEEGELRGNLEDLKRENEVVLLFGGMECVKKYRDKSAAPSQLEDKAPLTDPGSSEFPAIAQAPQISALTLTTLPNDSPNVYGDQTTAPDSTSSTPVAFVFPPPGYKPRHTSNSDPVKHNYFNYHPRDFDADRPSNSGSHDPRHPGSVNPNHDLMHQLRDMAHTGTQPQYPSHESFPLSQEIHTSLPVQEASQQGQGTSCVHQPESVRKPEEDPNDGRQGDGDASKKEGKWYRQNRRRSL